MNKKLIILTISIFIFSFLAISINGGETQQPFTIEEKTIYDISTNTQYMTITENLGKDQNINLSHILDNNFKTSNIEIKSVLLNQSYNYQVYEYVNKSIDKVSKTINGTHYNSKNEIIYCSYVLEDKSCLILSRENTRNETRYDFLPLSTLKKEKVSDLRKIENKITGINLPKKSKIQLKIVYSHPLAIKENKPTDLQNKYNISVISNDGVDKSLLDPVWWNSSWLKAQPIILSTSSGYTGTSYQITKNISYDSDMQTDFDDLRFVDDDNTTALDYWIETKSDSNWALVWIEVKDNITTTNQTIYMYYNNSGATSLSNASSTFIYGDDFSTNTTTNYYEDVGTEGSTLQCPTGWNSGGYLYSCGTTSASFSNVIYPINEITYTQPSRAITRVRSTHADVETLGVGMYEASNHEVMVYRSGQSSTGNEFAMSLRSTEASTDGVTSLNDWFPLQIIKIGDVYSYYNSTANSFSNALNYVGNYTSSIITSPNVSLNIRSFKQEGDFDYFLVAKFSGNEPIIYSGSEINKNIEPTINIINPTSYQNLSSSSITFSCLATDSEDATGINITLLGNWTGSWAINDSNSSVYNNTQTNFTKSLSDGIYKVGCLANDTTGNTNYSTNTTFTIDTNAPIITLPFYTNATLKKNTQNLTLNISITDATSGFYNSLVNVNINGTNQSFSINNGWVNFTEGNLTGLSDGNHTILVYANDSAGNLALNNSFYVFIDSTSPNITINQPTGTKTSTNVSFNISLADISSYSFCTAWVTRGASEEIANTTLTCSNSVTGYISLSGDSTYVFHFFVNDTLGNANYSNSTFIVSTPSGTPPSGGGGSVIIQNKETSWTMEVSKGIASYDVGVPAGTSRTLSIDFKNLGTTSVALSLFCEDVNGSLCKYVTFDEKAFELPLIKDTITKKYFTITLPEDITKTSYQFNIRAEQDNNIAQSGVISVRINTDLNPFLTFFTKLLIRTKSGYPYALIFLPILILSLFLSSLAFRKLPLRVIWITGLSLTLSVLSVLLI